MSMKSSFGETRKPNILVVEDSPTQAAYLKELLEDTGLQFLWAQNGRECLRMVPQVCPDLIILDLEMPEMNGIETCKALKSDPEMASIPVIMFTRHEEPEYTAYGLQSGAVDYIPKDAFATAVLLETLKQMGFLDEVPPHD